MSALNAFSSNGGIPHISGSSSNGRVYLFFSLSEAQCFLGLAWMLATAPQPEFGCSTRKHNRDIP